MERLLERHRIPASRRHHDHAARVQDVPHAVEHRPRILAVLEHPLDRHDVEGALLQAWRGEVSSIVPRKWAMPADLRRSQLEAEGSTPKTDAPKRLSRRSSSPCPSPAPTSHTCLPIVPTEAARNSAT